VRRIEAGFSQLAKHPVYLDLPAYDALRQLGSGLGASSTIGLDERVLVLCSYEKAFFTNWERIRSGLRQALSRLGKKSIIERIIDYGSPQLIWQNLFEQIRRTSACVVDWTEYSPSVFLELGVRLAVSAWGAIQIVDTRYLPDALLSKSEAQTLAEIEKREDLQVPRRKLRQIKFLHKLFRPTAYRYDDASADAFNKSAVELQQRVENLDGSAEFNRIHRVLWPVIDRVQELHPPIYKYLSDQADALHQSAQERTAAPQILFSGSPLTKKDSERAALEMRIAAWLYLEHRADADKLRTDADLQRAYEELGRSAKDALYVLLKNEAVASGEYRQTERLAEYIEGRLKAAALQPTADLLTQVKQKQEDARSHRRKGEALEKSGEQNAAAKEFEAGLAALEDAIALMEPQASQLHASALPSQGRAEGVLKELIETFGAQGGLLQRLDRFKEAAQSYSRGAVLEKKFDLASTYNRLNAVKCALQAGTDTLAELEPEIKEIRNHIEDGLRSDRSLSDSGWAWADLGDCFALLGETKKAGDAYATFIAKADSNSPERTLRVLQRIAAKVKDPKARRRLREVIGAIETSRAAPLSSP
jgi:tetratricopeptide (TPR) repeat protein